MTLIDVQPRPIRTQATRLFIRCDDAGSSPHANAGVLAAVASGLPCNVSVMAVGPALADIAPRLRELGRERADAVCVGLHVTLTSEWDGERGLPVWGPLRPASRVRSLLDARGVFPRTLRQLGSQIDLGEAIDETRAQLDRLRSLGLRVDYLDEHMGVGWAGDLRERLLRLADAEGLIAAERFAYAQPPCPDADDTAALRDAHAFTTPECAIAGASASDGLIWVTHPEATEVDSVPSDRPERVRDLTALRRPDLANRIRAGGFRAALFRDAAGKD